MSDNKSPVANFFLWLEKFSNGKKTNSGLTLVIGGVAVVLFDSEHRAEGINMIALGLPLLIAGITHKVVKNS